MRNLKKVIALIAVFAMTLSTAVFAAEFPDVAEDSAAHEAISTLADLGIIQGDEQGNYNPDQTVTRAEMATFVARIQGYEGDVSQTETPFTDVPSTHWASGYIALAAGQGIVNGYGDGNFGPEDPVNYEDAIKMVMVTLGYEPMAADQGGYPAGYISAANSQKVLSGVVGGVTGQGCSRSTIAQLLYNAIDTPLMIRTGYGTESSYVVTGTNSDYDRQTLMSERLDIVKLKGIVVTNEVTSIRPDTSVTIDTTADPMVTVNVTGNYQNYSHEDYGDLYSDEPNYFDFRIGESNAGSFLGKQVVFYVKEDINYDYDTVLSMTEESGRNNEVTFTLDQYDRFEQASGSNSYDSIYYLRNETDRTATRLRLQDGASVVYNGLTADINRVFSNYVQQDSTVGGKVTVIDSDNTSGYDIVLVEVAATAVVDEVDGTTIKFKNNVGSRNYNNSVRNIDFDEDATDFICTITKDGVEIPYTDLKEWDVLSVITNNDVDGEVYDVRVVSNQVDGSIDAVRSSDTSATGSDYRIDGNWYDAAEGYYSNGTLEAGAAGMFYIDEYGKIAAYDKNGGTSTSRSADNYAYVIGATVTTGMFNEDGITLRLLTRQEGVSDVSLADAFTISEYNASSSSDSNIASTRYDMSDLNEGDPMSIDDMVDKLDNKMIRFGVNSNGYINNIELSVSTDNADTESDFQLVAYANGNGDYDEDGMTLDGDATVDVNEETLVFFVPSRSTTAMQIGVDSNGNIVEVTNGATASSDNAYVGVGTDLAESNNLTFAAYDEDESGFVDVVVVYNENGLVSPSSSMAVIQSVSTAMDEEGDDVFVIEYMMDGETHEAYTTPDVVDNGDISVNVAAGTVCKFSFDGDKIKRVVPQVIFDENGGNLRTRLSMTGSNSATAGLVTYDVVGNDYAAGSDATETYAAGYVVDYNQNNDRVVLADADGSQVGRFNLRNASTVYYYDPALRASSRIDVGSSSDAEPLDEGLYMDGGKVVTDDNDQDTILENTPAYGMLPFVVVRMYDNRPAEALVILSYEYDDFMVVPAGTTPDEPDEVPATAVSINSGAESVDVTAGNTVTLTAAVTPDDSTDEVAWTISDYAGLSISSAGVVTATADAVVGDGVATVTATAGDVSDTILIDVVAAASGQSETEVTE